MPERYNKEIARNEDPSSRNQLLHKYSLAPVRLARKVAVKPGNIYGAEREETFLLWKGTRWLKIALGGPPEPGNDLGMGGMYQPGGV